MGSLSQIGANKASSITDFFLPILVNAMSSVTLKNPVLVTWTTSLMIVRSCRCSLWLSGGKFSRKCEYRPTNMINIHADTMLYISDVFYKFNFSYI